MRILLIRTSSLGDIVHCLPALRALRRHFPDATIGWVVEEVFAPLLAHDPDLDQLLTVRLRQWRRSPFSAATVAELRSSLGRLPAFGADVVLDLMGNHKAGALAALTTCDRRIGLSGQWRRERSSAAWLSEWVEASGRHAVDRALAVASALGMPPEFMGFGPEKILAAAGDVAAPAGSGDHIVIHPGAAWPSKRYPAERWGRVAAALAAETGRTVLVSAGPGETELQDEVERASGGAARRVAAADLPRLISLLSGASLVLGGDTGPLHLAHALGVPTLFLHGPTDPATHGPYRAPERALRAPEPAGSAGYRGGDGSAEAVDLPEALVVERALALASNIGQPEAPGEPERGPGAAVGPANV
jgi:heptosyltransferase-1